MLLYWRIPRLCSGAAPQGYTSIGAYLDCALALPRRYVFMFGVLLLLSTLLLREVGALEAHTRAHRRYRAAMGVGSLAILLTAIYPEHLERDGDGGMSRP